MEIAYDRIGLTVFVTRKTYLLFCILVGAEIILFVVPTNAAIAERYTIYAYLVSLKKY